jgi:hypothetical protein
MSNTKFMSETFLNKEVRLHPNDTYYKYAIVKDINDVGIVFQITKAHPYYNDVYVEGTILFISNSSNMSFTLA